MARWVVSGLAGVLAGSDPVPAWRSPWWRRAAFAALAVATPLSCLTSVSSLQGVGGGLLLYLPRQNRRSLEVDSVAPGARLAPFHPGWMPVGSALAVGVLIAVLLVMPLPLAARYPLLGWRIGWLGLWLVPLAGVRWRTGWPWDPVQIVTLLVAFCVAGVRVRRPVLCWMCALMLIPWWWGAGAGWPTVADRAAGTMGLIAAAVAVDAIAARRRAQRALAGEAERAELEQARRAVLEERARIAREMHDVVAHHLSLIAVRAESAPFRLPGLGGPLLSEFGSLSGAAREALTDMRRLLGVLRQDQPAALAPQPQLSDLPGLIDTARQAGVAVRLTAPEALGGVPPGVGVCAYRIVQESLSNASRHAPGAPVSVSVGQDAGTVRLRVANGPGHGRGGDVHGPGQGLAGMRERVALLGGSLSVGPVPGGGFVVSAVLPLGQLA